MHAIESKDDFEMELSRVLTKINSRVVTLSEMLNIHNGQDPDVEFEELNTLKIHRYKVEALLEKIEAIPNEKWEQNKNNYQEVFKKANDIFK